MTAPCKFDQVFDAERKLQYVNGEASVMHCHHYATIFTKLALDTPHLNGPENLFEAMEETAYLTLRKYFLVESISSPADRQAIASQYFALCGLGLVSLEIDENGGRASMRHSHVDEGWLKKWGPRRKPVNLMGQGYLAGAMSAIFDQPVGTYRVKETRSIVSGAEASELAIQRR